MYPITSKNDSMGTMLSSKLSVSIAGYLNRFSDREFLIPLHLVTSSVLSLPPHNLDKYSTLGMIFSARLEKYVEGAGCDYPCHQASEVESKVILMGYPISCCHAPVVRSFFIHCKMIISP
jgi:hypothetical protein